MLLVIGILVQEHSGICLTKEKHGKSFSVLIWEGLQNAQLNQRETKHKHILPPSVPKKEEINIAVVGSHFHKNV